MHEKLDNYLAKAAARLQKLPPPRREAELTEIRQHLLALVESGLLLGESEDEAVAAAIRQFDPYDRLPRDLKRVWYRGQIRRLGATPIPVAVAGAVRGAALGVALGALMDIAMTTGSGGIAAGWWSPIICLAALVVLWAGFMGTIVHAIPTMPVRRGLQAGALMGLVAGVCCIAGGSYFGLYSGTTSLISACTGVVAVLTNQVPIVRGSAGGAIYGSFYVLLNSALLALAGAFWNQLFRGSQHILGLRNADG